MSRKADCKRLLHDLCGEAAASVFKQAPVVDDGAVPSAPLLVQDALVALRKGIGVRTPYGNAPIEPRWCDYWLAQSSAVQRFFERPQPADGLPGDAATRPRRFVMVFDKPEHTPAVKNVVQPGARASTDVDALEAQLRSLRTQDISVATPAGRREATRRDAAVERTARQLADAREARAFAQRCAADARTLEQPAPTDVLPYRIWEHILGDRRQMRAMLVRNVVTHLMRQRATVGGSEHFADDVDYVVRPPPEAMLIVDGHCMSLSQARAALGPTLTVATERAEQHGDDAHRDIPLALYTTKDGKKTHAIFLYSLANAVGEADLGVFFYARRYASRYRRVQIESTDTDVVLLAMLYVDQRQARDADDDKQEVYVRWDNAGRAAVSPGGQRMCTWFHANSMNRVLYSHTSLSGLDNPVTTLVAALAAGGSDYTANHYYVPHRHFVAALCAEPRQLVDPARGDAVVSPTAYQRLVHLAYHSTHVQSFKDQPLGAADNAAVAARVRARISDARKHVPDAANLLTRHRHLTLLMHMWLQVSAPRILLLNPAQHGYAPCDDAPGRWRALLAPPPSPAADTPPAPGGGKRQRV